LTPFLKQQAVGEHVRRLRERSGLSLRALAARTDFSPSFISQLEHGQVSPSIHSMEKIASALGVTLSAFFGAIASGEGGLVTRSRQRGRLSSSWSQADVEMLSPMSAHQRLEPLLITLQPGGRSGKHPVSHHTEEFALVMKGSVRLRLGPDEYRLAAGDSVTLLADELRLWVNEGQKPCSVLVVALRAGG
jgi:transcriptional regulator with XRE-family HTH domain